MHTVQRLGLLSLVLAGSGAAVAQPYTAIILPLPGEAPWSVGSGASNGIYGGYSVPPGGSSGYDDRAIIWRNGTPFDVTPTGVNSARITNSRDGQHVGATGGFAPYAFMWNDAGQGTALHPGWPYTTSDALGVGGGKQVGYARLDSYCSECGVNVNQHAGMWSGSSASFTRLHSPIHYHTAALDTTGTVHVGWGLRTDREELNALLWNGGNAISLHPTQLGFNSSAATCIFGNNQGGWGESPTGYPHALIWSRTAQSAIDLHPANWAPISWSGVNAVTNSIQVGGGYDGFSNAGKARAWKGSAASIIDLHQFLPAGFRLGGSNAIDVDVYGNIVGTCTEDTTGLPRAVIWVPFVKPNGSRG